MMSGAFSLVNVLADSLGPGTVGFKGEPKDFFMASAGLCLVGVAGNSSGRGRSSIDDLLELTSLDQLMSKLKM
jgi:hypothetical protein